MLLATVKGDVHDIGKNIVGVVLQCNNYEVIDLGVMVPSAKILETARREGVDLIGLSGLITPSLEEMSFVASELEREGFQVPLLIGGATTSRTHTAVKIEPNYHGAVVHVLDASRAVGVAGSLLSPGMREGFAQDVRTDYKRIREERAGRGPTERLVKLTQARANRLTIDWATANPPAPCVLGAAHARRLSAGGAGGPDRLDAVLPDLGAGGTLPRHPRGPEGRAGGAEPLPGRPARCSTASSASGC